MSDKTQWTNKSKKGDSQETTFQHNKYPETSGERDFPAVSTTSASRGEDNFAKIQTAR